MKVISIGDINPTINSVLFSIYIFLSRIVINGELNNFATTSPMRFFSFEFERYGNISPILVSSAIFLPDHNIYESIPSTHENKPSKI